MRAYWPVLAISAAQTFLSYGDILRLQTPSRPECQYLYRFVEEDMGQLSDLRGTKRRIQDSALGGHVSVSKTYYTPQVGVPDDGALRLDVSLYAMDSESV